MLQRIPKTRLVLIWALSLALLYAFVWLIGQSLGWLAARWDAWGDIGVALLDSSHCDTGEVIAAGGAIVLAFAVPHWRRKWFSRWERVFQRCAVHRTQAIVAAAILPMVARIALLPAIPLPHPYVPDEFGHLLLADTFASGRIANPTHPMWRYFETLYVFHQPTYTSLYPMAQGFFLSVPLVLGMNPWFGVCASIGLMCAALCWMLQAWLPPKWALLGALIAGGLSITTYWMNSYWGRAAGAIGGALLLGALPRLLRRVRVRDALLAGLGAAVLSQSRPFEGALLCLPVGAVILARLAFRPHRNIRALAALAGGAALIAAGTLYYNYRVTGNPWLLPYQWHQKVYGMPQSFRGRAAILTAWRAGAEKDILDNFHWQLGLFQAQSTWKGLAAALPGKMATFWEFYFPPVLGLPLLFLPFLRARADTRFLVFTGAFVLYTEFVLYPFFFPHYAAPLYGGFIVLAVQGARAMRVVRWRGRRVGAALFRGWVAIGVASASLLAAGAALAPELVSEQDTPRSQIEQTLEQRGGKHLVLVHYTAAHDYHDQWIYNSADIDRSRVIWARELGPARTAQLLCYYPDREVWLVNADEEEPRLIRYPRTASMIQRSSFPSRSTCAAASPSG